MRDDANPSMINLARASNENETVAQFSPGELFAVLRRGWKIIAVTTLVFLVLIGLQLMRATPRYDAYAQMLLGEQGLSDRVAFNLVESATLSNSIIEGELAVLRSNALLVRVAQRLQLDKVPEFNPSLIDDAEPSMLDDLKAGIKSLLGMGAVVAESGAEPSGIDLAAQVGNVQMGEFGPVVGKLRQAISVRQLGTSYVVQVSATTEDSNLSAAISNALMEEYIAFLAEKRFKAAQRFVRWLENRVGELATILEKSERDVLEFRAKMEGEADSRSRLEQQMRELTSRLVDQRAQLTEAQAMYSEFEETVKRAGLLGAADWLASNMILELRSELEQLRQREAMIVNAFGENTPKQEPLRRSLQNIEEQISTEVTREMERLRNRSEVLAVVVTSLEKSLSEMSGQVIAQSGKEIQLNQLERVAEANREVYQEFLARFKETSELSNLETPDADVISYASPPASPSYPRKKMALGLALFGGLFAGAALVIALERMPKRIRTAESLSQTSGLPVFGRFAGPDSDVTGLDLLKALDRDPNGPLAKASFQLAANAQSRSSGALNTVSILPSQHGVDGPAVALMLSWALSQRGHSVAIVDLDTDRAQTSAFFGESAPALGLDTVVYDQDVLSETMRTLGDQHVGFLPIQAGTTDPVLLLQSKNFSRLCEELAVQYQTVIHVLPEAHAGASLNASLPLSNLALMVLRAKTMTRAQLDQPLAQLRDSPARSFGTVLTGIS